MAKERSEEAKKENTKFHRFLFQFVGPACFTRPQPVRFVAHSLQESFQGAFTL
jgi:hypothetical protein